MVFGQQCECHIHLCMVLHTVVALLDKQPVKVRSIQNVFLLWPIACWLESICASQECLGDVASIAVSTWWFVRVTRD